MSAILALLKRCACGKRVCLCAARDRESPRDAAKVSPPLSATPTPATRGEKKSLNLMPPCPPLSAHIILTPYPSLRTYVPRRCPARAPSFAAHSAQWSRAKSNNTNNYGVGEGPMANLLRIIRDTPAGLYKLNSVYHIAWEVELSLPS
jgi:hypothetical protein